jgi:phosphohistidine phosphatase SixA
MRLFLIRHAQAGDRTAGQRDLFRPLTPKGHERAQALAELLADQGVSRILSSPATRCVQTMAPLARALGLEVEQHPDLWEGSAVNHVLALLENHGSPVLAACSHGDVIPDVIEALGRGGVPGSGRGCEKGSVWVLDHDGRRWTAATYLDRSQTRLPAGEEGAA